MPVSEVFNEDNMTMMARYPDGYFDLAVVDPPYGIGIVAPGKRTLGRRKGQPGLTNYKSASWDSCIPDEAYFIELKRVSKNQVIFGGNYFVKYLDSSPGWIVWDKHQPAGVTFAQAELAYTSFKRSVKKFECSKSEIGNCVSNNRQLAKVKAKIHPTQKPIPLYRWIFENYGEGCKTILDTHLGSGSSRIAAYDLGFDFYGCELDPDYFTAQNKRYAIHIAQQKLFIPQRITPAESTLF